MNLGASLRGTWEAIGSILFVFLMAWVSLGGRLVIVGFCLPQLGCPLGDNWRDLVPLGVHLPATWRPIWDHFGILRVAGSHQGATWDLFGAARGDAGCACYHSGFIYEWEIGHIKLYDFVNVCWDCGGLLGSHWTLLGVIWNGLDFTWGSFVCP